MATRTVRFDEETEKVLEEIRSATGWPISDVLKRGLRALLDQVRNSPTRLPYDVYQELDLGPGGYAVASSDNTRAGLLKALRRKLDR